MKKRYLMSFEDQTSALDYINGDTTLVAPMVSLIGDDEVVYSKDIPNDKNVKFAKDETTGKLYFIVDVVGPADNEIWYTSTDSTIVSPYRVKAFSANIVSNEYNDGRGVITFDGPVTSIGMSAFTDCYYLTSVTIPNSVKYIRENAFMSCTALTSINIHSSVASIKEKAFRDCSSLTSVTIGNSVTSIGDYAFSNCTSLKSITIPNSVRNIHYGAFYDCTLLTSITFEGTMAEWNSISKFTSWNKNVPATYVQCSDGQVSL